MRLDNSAMVYINNRLMHWALWSIKKKENAQGYADSSTIDRIRKTGPSARAGGPKVLPTYQAATEIDTVINELAEFHPFMAEVLRYHYTAPGSLRTKAAFFKMSATQMQVYVDRGRYWLAGRLRLPNKMTTTLS